MQKETKKREKQGKERRVSVHKSFNVMRLVNQLFAMHFYWFKLNCTKISISFEEKQNEKKNIRCRLSTFNVSKYSGNMLLKLYIAGIYSRKFCKKKIKVLQILIEDSIATKTTWFFWKIVAKTREVMSLLFINLFHHVACTSFRIYTPNDRSSWISINVFKNWLIFYRTKTKATKHRLTTT